MPRLKVDTLAPDFSLTRFDGQTVFRLSEQLGRTHVILVFNRGFL